MPGVAVTAPVHVPPIFDGFATVTPAGNGSTIDANKVATDPVGFVKVIDKFETPPDIIVSDVNNLAIVGWPVTVNGAVAGFTLLP